MAGEEVIGQAFIEISPVASGFEEAVGKLLQSTLERVGLGVEMPGVREAVVSSVEQGLRAINWEASTVGRLRSALTGQFTELGAEVEKALRPMLAGLGGEQLTNGLLESVPVVENLNEKLAQTKSDVDAILAAWVQTLDVDRKLVDLGLNPGQHLAGQTVLSPLGVRVGQEYNQSVANAYAEAMNAKSAEIAQVAGEKLKATLLDAVKGYSSAFDSTISGITTRLAEGVRSSVAGISESVRGAVTGGLTAAGIAGGVLLGAGISKAIAGISAGSQLEGVRNTLTELTGSLQTSDSVIAQLQKTSVQTGQAFQPLADSAKQLIAVGQSANTAVPALSAIADYITVFSHGTASSTQGIQRATLALQEMGLQGTVQAKFLRQLVNDGVPAYKILVDAAQRSGVQLGQNDAALLKASTAQDTLTKATLTLQTAQQNQATALAKHGAASSEYANATRTVEKAQIDVTSAQQKATDAANAADTALTDGTGEVAKAMKAGQITATAYYQALADPQQLSQIQNVIGSLNDNLVFSLNRIRAGIATGSAQFFEPVQKGLAQALSGIVAPMENLITSNNLARLGQAVANAIPTAPLQAAGQAVGRVVDEINRLTGPQITAALGRLQSLVPLIGALAGGAGALALSWGAALPLVGGLFPQFNPLLGVIAGLVVATPKLRDSVLDLAQTFGADLLQALQALQPLLDPLTAWLDRVAIGAKPVVQALGTDIADAARIVEPVLAEVVSWLGRGLVDAEGAAASALGRLDLLLRGIPLQSIVGGVEKLVSDVGSALAGAVGNLASALGRVNWSEVGRLVSNLASALDALLPYLLTLAGAVLSDIAGKLNAVVPLLANMLGSVRDLVPGTKDLNSNLAVTVPLVEALAVALAGVKIGAALAPAVQAITALGGAIAGVTGIAAFGVGLLAIAFGAAQLLYIGYQVSLLLQDWNRDGPQVSAAFSALGGKFSDLGTAVRQMVDGARRDWQQFASDPAYYIGQAVGWIILNWINWLPGQFEGMGAKLRAAQSNWLAPNLWDTLRTSLETLIPQVLSKWAQFWTDMGSAASRVNWAQVGRNIIDGIVAGFKLGASEVNPAIVGTITEFLRGLLSQFHIAGQGHSPYAFFNPVGQNIVDGVLQGMQKAESAVSTAAAQLLRNLIPSTPGLTVGAALTGGSTLGLAGSTVIYLTVNIGGTNASPLQIAQAIGSQLSARGVIR